MSFARDAARTLRRLAIETSGTTVIEYGLIIFIVTLAIGFLLPDMGASIIEIFDGVTSAVDTGVAAGGES